MVPTQIANAVAALHEAASCRACRRGPSHYFGALLLSSCGHLFCGDCWDQAVTRACPICQSIVVPDPRPFAASLASGRTPSLKERPDHGEDAILTNTNPATKGQAGMHITPANASKEIIEQLGALLEILSQVKGCCQTIDPDDAVGETSDGGTFSTGDGGDVQYEESECATAVPRACSPSNGGCENNLGRQPIITTSVDLTQQITVRKRRESSEELIIRESRRSSVLLSAVKSTNTNDLKDELRENESEVPATLVLCKYEEGSNVDDLNDALEEDETIVRGTGLVPPLQKQNVSCKYKEGRSNTKDSNDASDEANFESKLLKLDSSFLSEIQEGTCAQKQNCKTSTESQCLASDDSRFSASDAAEGPRRVSTSPDFVPIKQQGVKDRSVSMQRGNRAVAIEIVPWNHQGKPLLSPLTCDVPKSKFGRISSSRDPHTSIQTSLLSVGKNEKSHVAHEAVEARALKFYSTPTKGAYGADDWDIQEEHSKDRTEIAGTCFHLMCDIDNNEINTTEITTRNVVLFQHTTTQKRINDTETAAIYEKQHFDLLPSSIKDNAKSLNNALEENETQVSDIYLASPLQNMLCKSKPKHSLKLNQTETLGTYLASPLQKEVYKSDDGSNAKDSNHVLEENETEVPGTYLEPPLQNTSLKSQTGSIANSLEVNKTELSRSYLPAPIQHVLLESEVGSKTKDLNYVPFERKHESKLLKQDCIFDVLRKRCLQKQGCKTSESPCSASDDSRFSTSPNKRLREGLNSGHPFRPTIHQRFENGLASMQEGKEAARDIKERNIQSELLLSPLTCDVWHSQLSCVPSGRDPRTCFHTNSSPVANERKLHVAFDVLHPVEAQALQTLHEKGFLHIALDGIQRISKCGNIVPFPETLITHGVGKPGIGSQEQYKLAYRTVSSLKASALGAHIVDARWAIDSVNAGLLLDRDKYMIWSDVESHGNCNNGTIADMLDQERQQLNYVKFDGINFGLLRSMDRNPLSELNESSCQPDQLQLHLETRPMTTPEIESLVHYWGGRVTTDSLTHIDYLLVDDFMTLDQMRKVLQQTLKTNSGVDKWSIRSAGKTELNNFIVNGALTDGGVNDFQVRVPVVQIKWLEDSISVNYLKKLNSYCLGILTFG